MFFKAKPITEGVPPFTNGVLSFTPGIPKVIHQIWIGGKPLPAQWAHYGEQIKALHPSWAYRLWTDADLPGLWDMDPFGLKAVYALWENVGYQSDILRLLILWLYGGVYLDTDCEPARPLDAVLVGRDAFVGATFPGEPFPRVLVQNAVLGACPRHPWLTLTINRMRADLPGMDFAEARKEKTNILDLTGPGRLSATLAEYRASRASYAADVAILPSRFLFPSGPDQAPTPERFPEVFLIHHWVYSWNTDIGEATGSDTAHYVPYGPPSAPYVDPGKGV